MNDSTKRPVDTAFFTCALQRTLGRSLSIVLGLKHLAQYLPFSEQLSFRIPVLMYAGAHSVWRQAPHLHRRFFQRLPLRLGQCRCLSAPRRFLRFPGSDLGPHLQRSLAGGPASFQTTLPKCSPFPQSHTSHKRLPNLLRQHLPHRDGDRRVPRAHSLLHNCLARLYDLAHQLAPLFFHHESAHACHPWNELVDSFAIGAVACSVCLAAQARSTTTSRSADPDHLCDTLPVAHQPLVRALGHRWMALGTGFPARQHQLRCHCPSGNQPAANDRPSEVSTPCSQATTSTTHGCALLFRSKCFSCDDFWSIVLVSNPGKSCRGLLRKDLAPFVDAISLLAPYHKKAATSAHTC